MLTEKLNLESQVKMKRGRERHSLFVTFFQSMCVCVRKGESISLNAC